MNVTVTQVPGEEVRRAVVHGLAIIEDRMRSVPLVVVPAVVRGPKGAFQGLALSLAEDVTIPMLVLDLQAARTLLAELLRHDIVKETA